MENREQIRQSLEDIYNQILPTLEKLEVKRLEYLRKYTINRIIRIVIIALFTFCCYKFVSDIFTIYMRESIIGYIIEFILYTGVGVCLSLLIFPPKRALFTPKQVKDRLKYKLLEVFGLHHWDENGKHDSFSGKYKDVIFYVKEHSDMVNIKFYTGREYKTKTEIYSKGTLYGGFTLKELWSFDFIAFVIHFCVQSFFILLGFIVSVGCTIYEYTYWYAITGTLKVLLVIDTILLSGIIYVICALVDSYKLEYQEKRKGKLNLESVDFKKKFEVYGDEVEGRYALTTAFMNRLLTMQTAFGSGDLTCIIDGNSISFEIKKTKDLFEVADMNKPVNSPECIKEFYNEMTSIWDMIDHFKLDENIGL